MQDEWQPAPNAKIGRTGLIELRKLRESYGPRSVATVTVLLRFGGFVTVTIWLHRKTNGTRVVTVTDLLRPRFWPGGVGYEKP